MRHGIILGLVAGLALLGGCATDQEPLLEKDRQLMEAGNEAEALRQQVEDAREARQVLEDQVRDLQDQLGRTPSSGEVDRLQAQLSQLQRDQREARQRAEEAERALAAYKQRSGSIPRGPDVNTSVQGVTVVSRNATSTLVRLSGNTFHSNQSTLTQTGEAQVAELGRILGGDSSLVATIEGHTDTRGFKDPSKGWGNNMNLSIARAMVVREVLATKYGISKKRLGVAGYADTRPLVVNAKSAADHAKNRRVEVRLSTR